MSTAQEIWKDLATSHAERINAYVAAGERHGWREDPGEAPSVPEDRALAEAALEAVRNANRAGTLATLREQWPPSHQLLLPLLDDKATDIPTIFVLDNDGSFAARIGPPYHPGKIVEVRGTRAITIEGVDHIGRSPDRRYFALANDVGVRITDGWLGPEVARCPWPTGFEGVPTDIRIEAPGHPFAPCALVPFNDGQRVLLACSEGVFVLTPAGATRLLPDAEDIRLVAGDFPGEAYRFDESMAHAALSPDNNWIAAGSQFNGHNIFDRDLELCACIGHASEYPHYACFSGDGQTLILNSCHFYHGATLAVKASDWPGLSTATYEPAPETPLVEELSRVYTAIHRENEFIIGNANGYLRAFSEEGRPHWYHFVGSTLSALDISPDGRHLYAASCAGWVLRIALDSQQQSPIEIGSGQHHEEQRWLFWNDEPSPLLW